MALFNLDSDEIQRLTGLNIIEKAKISINGYINYIKQKI